MKMSQRAVLIILDGFGIGPGGAACDAIQGARMPFFKDLMARYPHGQLLTHGEAVGLPDGVMGNSEVGHMTLGSGRVIYQTLVRIHRAVRDRSFFSNPVLTRTLDAAARASGRVHLLGLLSDGGVHSHIDHLLALIDLCVERQVPRVSLHLVLDGRDTPPDSSPVYVERVLAHPALKGAAGATRVEVATVMGRYWAMDRDQRAERTRKAYECMAGKGAAAPALKTAKARVLAAIQASHAAGVPSRASDEFMEPVVITPDACLRDGDGLVFFNYRADRARQITRALTGQGGGGAPGTVNGGELARLSAFAGMAVYDEKLQLPAAFESEALTQIWGELLERRKIAQFRVAETEKYAHVTFFFNGGREKPFVGEERLLVPSPKDVATYDLKPEMSAAAVAEAARARIEAGQHGFVLMNFANPDMVGHTGNYAAAVRAMEVIDTCLERVIGAAERSGFHTLLTADHGNVEEMCDHEGKPHTQHTLNPVPALWVPPGSANAPKNARARLNDGTLADIMPTLCELMGVPQPPEATGRSLLPTG